MESPIFPITTEANTRLPLPSFASRLDSPTAGKERSESQLRATEISIAGRWLRIASIKDEEWTEPRSFESPRFVIEELRESGRKADLFTFTDPLGCFPPRYSEFRVEWDNAAVVPIATFEEWWEKRLPQVTRKSVRRSEKRGLSVHPVLFDEKLISGIKRIYDETPVRQGRRFWHYGKDLETIKSENSSYLDRSDFFGAYFEGQMVGFIKVVHVGQVARIMQILSMNAHFDKRPANALLAKAVERCCQKGTKYFVYGKYVYGNKRNSPVTEFKRRNGFEELRFPRYYVPLTAIGNASLRCSLHLGVSHILPEAITEMLLNLRAAFYARVLPTPESQGRPTDDAQE